MALNRKYKPSSLEKELFAGAFPEAQPFRVSSETESLGPPKVWQPQTSVNSSLGPLNASSAPVAIQAPFSTSVDHPMPTFMAQNSLVAFSHALRGGESVLGIAPRTSERTNHNMIQPHVGPSKSGDHSLELGRLYGLQSETNPPFVGYSLTASEGVTERAGQPIAYNLNLDPEDVDGDPLDIFDMTFPQASVTPLVPLTSEDHQSVGDGTITPGVLQETAQVLEIEVLARIAALPAAKLPVMDFAEPPLLSLPRLRKKPRPSFLAPSNIRENAMAKQANSLSKSKVETEARRTRTRPTHPVETRRWTRASALLEEKVLPASTSSNSTSTAQPNKKTSCRKRWFLAYVEIPPYPRVQSRLDEKPTLAKPEKADIPKNAKAAESSRRKPSLDGTRLLRRSKRRRTNASPCVAEDPQEIAPTKAAGGGLFDWWYESEMSPLTDIGSLSRSPTPALGVTDAWDSQIRETDVPNDRQVLPSSNGPATNGSTPDDKPSKVSRANECQKDFSAELLDKPDTSSLSLIPSQRESPSDDGWPTEVPRTSPNPDDGFGIEPGISPALTSVDSPERGVDASALLNLEETPVRDHTPAVKNLSQELVFSSLATALDGRDLDFVGNLTPIPQESDLSGYADGTPCHSHPHASHALPAEDQYQDCSYPDGQTVVHAVIGRIGSHTSYPSRVITAECVYGGYSSPGISSGWTAHSEAPAVNEGTSDNAKYGSPMSITPEPRGLFDVQRPVPSASSEPGRTPSNIPINTNISKSISNIPALSVHQQCGWAQSSGTTEHPSLSNASNQSSHFTPPITPPASWNFGFASVIPQDWLPNQPPPHPAALSEIAARAIRQKDAEAKRSPSPHPEQLPSMRVTRGYARKRMRTEHYEFSSFSYYPIDPSATASDPKTHRRLEHVLTSSSSSSSSMTSMRFQNPKASQTLKDFTAQGPKHAFSPFVNITSASFVKPGEKAKSFVSSGKYRPTGVRWK
ncbi:hypothetical protein FRB90_010066 [Tulasnella sp. 427]|nr:hypothetical protein FRB90_010066 [Tulasnella sp. 427]